MYKIYRMKVQIFKQSRAREQAKRLTLLCVTKTIDLTGGLTRTRD